MSRRTLRIADPGAPIGTVTEVVGAAQALTACGTNRALVRGGPVFLRETLTTAAGSSVAVRFLDATELMLSQNSSLTMDEYMYQGTEETDNGSFGYLQGIFMYTSGLIGKNKLDAVNIQTEVGAIGIRGTEFISIIDASGAGNVHHLATGKLAPAHFQEPAPAAVTEPLLRAALPSTPGSRG